MDLITRLVKLENQIEEARKTAAMLDDIAGYAHEEMLGDYERIICTAVGTEEAANGLGALLDDMTIVLDAVKSLVMDTQVLTREVKL